MLLRCLLIAGVLLAANAPVALAADEFMGDLELELPLDGVEATQDILEDIGGAELDDLELLRVSHLSEVHRWKGVRPARGAVSGEQYNWVPRAIRGYPGRACAGPASGGPVSTLVGVPEDGDYRIWLGYEGARNQPRPVTLALTGANTTAHSYGLKGLTGKHWRDQEKALPIRFDSERERMAAAVNPTSIVWEYWDTALEAGPTTLALSSKSQNVCVDAVFLTRSKDFDPSKAALRGNLDRTFYRFRVVECKDGREGTSVSEGLTYHWRHIPKGHERPVWYSSLAAWEPEHRQGPITAEDGDQPVPIGEWTRWIDATEAIKAPGSFATGSISFRGVDEGIAEVQIAWCDHPAAVLRTIRPRIGKDRALYMAPLDHSGYTVPIAGEDDREGVWGMRTDEYLNRLITASDVHERHHAWTREALAALGESKDGPTPKLVRLYAGCGPAPGAMDEAIKMLKDLGLNWLGGVPPDVSREYGLWDDYVISYQDALYNAGTHCPTDPLIEPNFTTLFEARAASLDRDQPGGREKVLGLKMGDEIGAITSPTHINECSDCRAAFHDYLRAQLEAMGEDATFFGVRNIDELPYLPSLPSGAGRFERRLYYHCERFKFILTATFYKRMTAAAQKAFPNVRTYCNFSPHPPMFGGHMNGSDWFVLTREGGATMGWGEDWATGGSWGMAGIQTVSYYGAWVECAARRHNMPAGFYNVASCGSPGRKMFSLLAHGISWQHIYDWGPQYMWAEGSNSWSESAGVYHQLARATRALGPADEIIAKGKREPRRVALLYNRTHEIWNGGYGGYQTDRLLTFLALQHAHIPVDIIIEDDLTPETLRPYSVLYVQGFNLAREHVAALEEWVEAGGVLYGIAGTAMRDRYNETMEDGARLFGATQRPAGCSSGGWHAMSIPGHAPIDTLKLAASPLTPEIEFDVVGVKTVLTPTTGRSIGTFGDGSCGAVLREAGKGKTLLVGVMPGLIYAHSAPRQNGLPVTYRADRRELISLAARRHIPRQRAEYGEPLTEICLFEHDSGIAVTLNDFSYSPGREATLSVEAGRQIKEVTSSLRGPLSWREEDGRVVVACPVPEGVDVVILR